VADIGKIKVFISWSGDLSKDIALAMHDWFENVYDVIDPFVSDVSIEPGTRSLEEIQKSLNGTDFGIVIVTKTNQNAPWLNYEAGALSKSISDSKNRVIPLLVDIENKSQVAGPIGSFQAERLDAEGFAKVLKVIAKIIEKPVSTVEHKMESNWPVLKAKIDDAKRKHPATDSQATPRSRPTDEMVEETLSIVRYLRDTQSVARRLDRHGVIARTDDFGGDFPTVSDLARVFELVRSDDSPKSWKRLESVLRKMILGKGLTYRDGDRLSNSGFQVTVDMGEYDTNRKMLDDLAAHALDFGLTLEFDEMPF
jgi:hypothetical protein